MLAFFFSSFFLFFHFIVQFENAKARSSTLRRHTKVQEMRQPEHRTPHGKTALVAISTAFFLLSMFSFQMFCFGFRHKCRSSNRWRLGVAVMVQCCSFDTVGWLDECGPPTHWDFCHNNLRGDVLTVMMTMHFWRVQNVVVTHSHFVFISLQFSQIRFRLCVEEPQPEPDPRGVSKCPYNAMHVR